MLTIFSNICVPSPPHSPFPTPAPPHPRILIIVIICNYIQWLSLQYINYVEILLYYTSISIICKLRGYIDWFQTFKHQI